MKKQGAAVETIRKDKDGKDTLMTGNRNAAQMVLKIKQKLQGVERGEPLAVEGQVKLLINEARDPSRLCSLFVGWSSWV
jgi:ataxia telangiectasia mutated family protein